MGKRLERWLALALMAAFVLAAAAWFIGPGGLGLWGGTPVTADSKALTAGLEKTSEELLARLELDGAALPYDQKTATFYCPLGLHGTRWPALSLRGVDSAGNPVALAFVDDYTALPRAQAVAEGRAFELLAYTGDAYRQYKIIFTGLPTLAVHTNEVSRDPLYPISGQDTAARVTLLTPGASSERAITCAAFLRIRGGASRTYPKKSYKLSLRTDDYEKPLHRKLLGMRRDDDWILHALYNDPTKMRDRLSWALWTRGFARQGIGLPDSGMGMEYVELFINDRYWGLYGLMEPADEKTFNLRESEDPGRSDYLYRSISYEIPKAGDYDAAAGGFTVPGYELRFPDRELNTPVKWEPLKRLTTLINLGTDQEFAAQAARVMDIDSTLNYWLFLQVVRGVDNGGKNVHIIARYGEGGHTLYFTPWDLDQTWGSQWNDTPPLLVEENMDSITEPTWFPPGTRLVDLNVAGSRGRVARQWADLRRVLLSDGAVEGLLAEYEREVISSGAMARDWTRWPQSPHTKDLAYFKEYVRQRLAWLDSYMAQLAQE